MAFVLLSHLFERVPCAAVAAPPHLCFSAPSCLSFYISHLLHGNIPMCEGKLQEFTEGSSLVSRTQRQQSFMYAFSPTSQGHALAPASEDIEAEVIGII